MNGRDALVLHTLILEIEGHLGKVHVFEDLQSGEFHVPPPTGQHSDEWQAISAAFNQVTAGEAWLTFESLAEAARAIKDTYLLPGDSPQQ